MRSRPFAQLPFASLPAVPRVPHPWDRAHAEELRLDSQTWGRHTVHLHTFGDGPPLLLVHGLMTAGYSWRYVLEPLGRRFRLIVPDLVGAGRTDKVAGNYHPDRLARWIGELVDALGIRGCPAIGNSLGGYLCMRLALLDPGALGRLVNLHSPGVPLKRLALLHAATSLPGAFTLLRLLVHRDPERWVHRNVHYRDESLKSLEEAREYAEALRTREGVEAFGRTLRDTLDPAELRRFVATLRARRDQGLRFPVPLLLLYAETDPVVPPRVGAALADLIPDAPYRVLAEASHFAHVDAVDRFLPPVWEFLGGEP